MKYKIFGGFLLVLGIVILLSVLYRNSYKRQQTIVYTPSFMLSALWESYKRNYWEESTGRTIDRQRSDITTSEGQSYTMLRAVWQDDKTTFDKTWNWTEQNLKHEDDNLFSWLYGTRPDGTLGILTGQGGQNAASDADSDIALALLFAGSRWHDPKYIDSAKLILSDMWDKEVVTIGGKPYLAANDVEKNSGTQAALINPSYLSPYAYRIFAKVDTEHDWNAIVDSSYSLLASSTAATLGSQSGANLPPDWVAINVQTATLTPPTQPTLTTNFGYDAIRIPWRIALDYQWNKDPRAKQVLTNMNFLSSEWQRSRMLASVYKRDGSVASNGEAPAVYGGTIGYFLVADPSKAQDVYNAKLTSLYSPDFQDWKTRLSYYDDNWAWFGLALYNEKLPNLYAPLAANNQ